MRIDFVSIFPELLAHWFSQGVIHQAIKKNILDFRYHSPRSFSDDKHGRVDDRPFGGGPGMVMQYAPLARCADFIAHDSPTRPFHIYMSPQGNVFNHEIAQMLAQKSHIVLWSGRYEGVDQRFIDEYIDCELSVGDFVLSGGELASAMITDALCRFIPDVLGDAASYQQDSFQAQLLDHPHYTRPEIAGIIRAPKVLLSGDHAQIARWRMKQALGRTFILRPDIFQNLVISDEQQALLNEFLAEFNFLESCDEQHH